MKTMHISMMRGQTLPITFIVKDERKARVDLTGATAFLHVRADMKVDASVKLASSATSGHRIGIVIDADQAGSGKGRFVATLVPADTSSLVALGDDDPYFYDAWIVDGTGQRFPVVATSRLGLYPPATTIS